MVIIYLLWVQYSKKGCDPSITDPFNVDLLVLCSIKLSDLYGWVEQMGCVILGVTVTQLSLLHHISATIST